MYEPKRDPGSHGTLLYSVATSLFIAALDPDL